MTYWQEQKFADMINYDELLAETPRAILVRWDERKEWIPSSQVLDHDPELRTLRLKYWIVEQKYLEDLVEEEGYE